MADATQQQQQQQPQAPLSTPFPTPPPFYKHFTAENITKFKRLRKEALNGTTSLPSELRYQIPPEPPADGKYNSFGHAIDLNASDPTLADSGIEQLYPSDPSVRLNPQSHLIALARSLLTTFLALTGILSQNPELFQEKTGDLQTIVFNMHDLINQYRPHQARETLILMMEERVEKLKEEMREIASGQEKMRSLLSEIQTTKPQPDHATIGESNGDVTMNGDSHTGDEAQIASLKAEQKAAWAGLMQTDT